ncbi:lipid kinase, YegS/Rv2252/BmrU family [Halobiforma haloterrestris]|uniref:Lipid kinase, YegS/Rv2252/BmrU family n=1 Tax=Natronobacterium haloterrestre TaxID=148448 RepID=A0A1I1DE81_NATHA|nr:YegS/Rv2252/BmrU family lipid kinase [Halobiforma haloterrestris]SFB70843.1 lipid kinase, YegS/Rv2252/BmrU family [Halobiforma haloterrestris]
MESEGRTEDRVLVLNPISGSGDHVDDVIDLAADHGLEIRRTEEAGDAKRFAREAAGEASLVAAAGGDGTINEVVNGVASAGELETTTVAAVPAGTGNNFASNVGIEGIEHAFGVLEDGRRRKIDLGLANERAFVNSCVGGVTAEASSETSAESKAELGVLAYVKETLDAVGSFDSLPLRVKTADGPSAEPSRTWEGEALFVLVGNCRRFTGARTAQADVEDGRFEVTIVEDASTVDLLGDAALEGLFDRDGDRIVRRRTSSLAIESREGSVEYSLDGEMLETERLRLETEPDTLEIAVGDEYEPNPDSNTDSNPNEGERTDDGLWPLEG